MRFFVLSVLVWAVSTSARIVKTGNSCEIYPEQRAHYGKEIDDVPQILEAFESCGNNGTVIFTEHLFYMNSVLNTTNLVNCEVVVRGELRFSTDIDYWRSHVYPVVFQNQSTAWLFGGTNVTFRAEGGWINGQGQEWYTWNHSRGNTPGRPISLTIYNSTNVLVDGLSVIQPQFWAMFVWESRNISIVNYFVNATGNGTGSTTNTDGYNSWNSDTLLIENADITNGDDCIAAKGNTTNLLVRNATCHHSNGITIGSIGQYKDSPDYVQNVTFDQITIDNCTDGAYIKTWSGVESTENSNGDAGGGGKGLVKNVTFSNFNMSHVGLPIQISQCIYTEKSSQYCNTSQLQIEDVTWVNITGTTRFNIAASIYCSPEVPCPGIRFDNVSLESVNHTLGLPMWGTNQQVELFQCDNIVDQEESGIPCNKVAPDNFGQTVKHNLQ
ncbi:uncharacterized protein TRUGW13939_11524 [Talaromyces rugulosus]|uniref:galacturonan 1,4-alpha-galacturonidase n=1 Tax=Talaromyces rugulosus TaxID=121627 RepID=A0A7H8RCZ5_TALRU|nr:uncharacterized protein TRUGW13939_11524 [Talaromyces rugulosus]QKX64350.1 hypothetical protein TRUGW13939_11524 [Talaromyces rugulosus]